MDRFFDRQGYGTRQLLYIRNKAMRGGILVESKGRLSNIDLCKDLNSIVNSKAIVRTALVDMPWRGKTRPNVHDHLTTPRHMYRRKSNYMRDVRHMLYASISTVSVPIGVPCISLLLSPFSIPAFVTRREYFLQAT